MALENRIDETLTESISVLKQVALFLTLTSVDIFDPKIFLYFDSNFQDYEQQVSGVSQLVSKLGTETNNSANDLETRLQVRCF